MKSREEEAEEKSHKARYLNMQRSKQLAILREESDYKKRCMIEMNKQLVESKLQKKEHDLLDRMRRDETSMAQMFQDYVQFKYDIYTWRLETQVKQEMFTH